MINVTIQIPRDLVPIVRTALEARAGEFDKAGCNTWPMQGTRKDWVIISARLRKLAKNLK